MDKTPRRRISNIRKSIFPQKYPCPCMRHSKSLPLKEDVHSISADSSPAASTPAKLDLKSYGVAIGDIATPCPTVEKTALVSEVEELLAKSNHSGVVVLEKDKPVGLVMKDRLYYQLGTHYGVSLYYRRPVEKVMESTPLIVNSLLPLEAVSKLVMARNAATMYDYIIVVKNDAFLGAVSIYSLLQHLTNLQIRRAFNASPLTGLPGNLLIEEHLKQLVQQQDPFAVLYLDLDHFKAFNDYYGFERGDQALKQTAAILSSCLAEFNAHGSMDFLGHIGGDDFVIITHWEMTETLCAAIVNRFDTEIRQLYCTQTLEKGYIKVINRKGEPENVPIMTISISVVTNRSRKFDNYLEIGEVAAELKKKAKKIPQSIWLVDNRSEKSPASHSHKLKH